MMPPISLITNRSATHTDIRHALKRLMRSVSNPLTKEQRPAKITLIILLICSLSGWSCSRTETNGFVDDRAGILSEHEQQRLADYYQTLVTDLALSCRLVILDRATDDIDGVALDLFADLGRQSGSARGLLVLVDPAGKQVRIEVGYDLEDMFPDAFIRYLEREQMTPFFRQGLIGAGIEATTELLIARASQAIMGQPFDPAEKYGGPIHFSGGAGARQAIAIGGGELDKTPADNPGSYRPQPTPEQSLLTYQQVLRAKIKDPDLPLYTPATRAFFAGWVVTDAQQDNALRSLEAATIDNVIISGNRAVIRFGLEKRLLPPYFLEHTGDGWAFDFASMHQIIRMNQHNHWRFTESDHAYSFGFVDWLFDADGFPVAKQ